MGIGIRKNIGKFYRFIKYLEYFIRKYLFGLPYALKMFLYLDKFTLKKILSKENISINKNLDIDTPLIIHNSENLNNLKIGKNCHIGKSCFFDLSDLIKIENNVTISMCNTFITHINVGKSILVDIYPNKTDKITINDNCYIGANCTILMGTELGMNCFVAAGSLVRGKFPPNSLIAGVPAKEIRKLK